MSKVIIAAGAGLKKLYIAFGGDSLIVQKEDEVLLEVQCHKIDAVLIFGNVQFTTQAEKLASVIQGNNSYTSFMLEI